MKKQIIAVVMIAGLTLAGTALANRGKGGGDCSRHSKMQTGMMYQQLDQATQDKIDTFRDDNQSLRKEMVMKRAEKQALLNNTNPDPVAVAKVTGELFDLRATMREKAEAAGVDQYMGRFGKGSGSKGRGHGGCQSACQGGGRF